jgi:17beta-estradiol 17-dehydrogenase / very-long-chain 3-oxoacyl-CoA reductase
MLPTPLLSTYAGTKAFLVHFTRSLEGELAGTKVDVKLLNTYYVVSFYSSLAKGDSNEVPQVSEMSKIRRSSLLVPTPKAYVTSVLAHPKSVGRGAGGRDAPYWSHALVEFVLDKLVGVKNEFLVTYVKGEVNHACHFLILKTFAGMNESIRKRALRKLERESGKKST